MVSNVVASAVNLDPRSYLANQANLIFATNTPQVDSLNSADTFSITISSSLGYFAPNSFTAPSSTLTITGSEASLNPLMDRIHFYPTKGSSASGIFTWAQSRNGTLEFTKTITLTGIANAFAEAVYTFIGVNDNTLSWLPTVSETYYGFADILIIGAGGNGGNARYPGYPGGGGGAGGYISLTNQSLPFNTGYSFTAGYSAGGTGNTVAFGQTAYRGQDGANRFASSVSGGSSGAPTSFSGNAASTSSGWGGGGGAGGSGAGGAASSNGTGGNGGLGILNSITGTPVYYCFGGGGGAGQVGRLGGDSGLTGGGGDWLNNPNPPGPVGNYGDGGGGQAASITANAPTVGAPGAVIIKVHA
jgi:hypothetical protein